MQSVSSYWMTAMEAETLQIITYGQVFPPLAAAATVPLGWFDVNTGQVNIDSTNAVRRTLASCVMVPYQFDSDGLPVPIASTDELFPEGNELALFKGVVYPDTPEYAGAPTISVPWVNGGVPFAGEVVQLGRFLMEDVEVYGTPSSGAFYVELNGSDRAATVARSVFTAPYKTNGTSTLDVQIKALLNNQISGLVYNFSPGTGTFPVPASVSFSIGDDPWASALQIAADAGFELYFDATGVCTMHPVLDPATIAPAATYVDGTSNIVTSVQRSLINTAVPNLIILISQGSNVTTPIQSVWWDSNPNSPTFYNSAVPSVGSSSTVPSPQGTYPTTAVTSTSSTATSQATNDAAARAVFLASYGGFETIDLKLRDNPAHDADDVVSITSADVGIEGTSYILDTVTIQCDYATEQEMKGRIVVGT